MIRAFIILTIFVCFCGNALSEAPRVEYSELELDLPMFYIEVLQSKLYFDLRLNSPALFQAITDNKPREQFYCNGFRSVSGRNICIDFLTYKRGSKEFEKPGLFIVTTDNGNFIVRANEVVDFAWNESEEEFAYVSAEKKSFEWKLNLIKDEKILGSGTSCDSLTSTPDNVWFEKDSTGKQTINWKNADTGFFNKWSPKYQYVDETKNTIPDHQEYYTHCYKSKSGERKIYLKTIDGRQALYEKGIKISFDCDGISDLCFSQDEKTVYYSSCKIDGTSSITKYNDKSEVIRNFSKDEHLVFLKPVRDEELAFVYFSRGAQNPTSNSITEPQTNKITQKIHYCSSTAQWEVDLGAGNYFFGNYVESENHSRWLLYPSIDRSYISSSENNPLQFFVDTGKFQAVPYSKLLDAIVSPDGNDVVYAGYTNSEEKWSVYLNDILISSNFPPDLSQSTFLKLAWPKPYSAPLVFVRDKDHYFIWSFKNEQWIILEQWDAIETKYANKGLWTTRKTIQNEKESSCNQAPTNIESQYFIKEPSGKQYGPYAMVNSIWFTESNNHWVSIIQDIQYGTFHVVIDGNKSIPFDNIFNIDCVNEKDDFQPYHTTIGLKKGKWYKILIKME